MLEQGLVHVTKVFRYSDEEPLAFLADLGVAQGPNTQTTLPINATFQTDDLDAFNSDCDEEPSIRVVLMANLSNYDSDVISDVLSSDTFQDNYVLDHYVQEIVGEVAYKLELPEELSRVHNTFHVSNLKKCHADEPLAVPLDGLNWDDKLHFVEEPVEIAGREVKQLKRSRIPLVKVRWNSKRGPEFTWEREDQFKKKYPHLFAKTTPSSSAAS
ncbi:hypothetical protein Tco_0603128 [Tanacetum coccineum]